MGLVFLVGLVILAAGLVVLAILNPISILTFFLGLGAVAGAVGAVLVGYWLWGLIHAGYALDRNALVITWGDWEYQVPLAEVTEVLRGEEVEGLQLGGVIRWPGYFVGTGAAPDLGRILFFATAPPDEQVILRTPGGAYAVSPEDREAFLPALTERLEMGPTQEVQAEKKGPAFLDWSIWHDRLAMGLLGASTLLLVLLVAVLTWRYPHLPPEVVMQVDPSGRVLLVAQPERIFYLGLLGGIFALVNGGLGTYLYHRRRIAGYMLWIGLVLLLCALWVAVFAILFNL